MTKKQQLGQFWTTNTDRILCGMEQLIFDKDVCDPFAGGGDLLNWAEKYGARHVMGYEIDEHCVDNKKIFLNDSLKNPLKYSFVITNPPYLYQNKMHDNGILKNSKHTDLFQLSLEKIMNSEEGIVIVPINFLSAENSRYIREKFLKKFEITTVNYFTEQVFQDTTYNVISFYYRKKQKQNNSMLIHFRIFPQNKETEIRVYEKYNWQIGGEFLDKIRKTKNRLGLRRFEEKDLVPGERTITVGYNHIKDKKTLTVNDELYNLLQNNIVLLKAIDTGSKDGKICLENIRHYGLDALVSLKTSRNQIQIIFPNGVTIDDQEEIIKLFNRELDAQREKYFSLFMTNFRDNDRKRISFNFAYDLINNIYFNQIKGEKPDETQLALF